MKTRLFSQKLLDKYPSIGMFLNIVYKPNLGEYSVFTTPTQYFWVKNLSEITDERLEIEIKKQTELNEFRETYFPEDLKNGDIENAILRSVHGSV